MGCAGAQPGVAGPQATTNALVRAIRSDEPARAYELLSTEVKAEVSLAAFEAQWRSHRAELLELGNALEDSANEGDAVARLPLGSLEAAVLVLEEDRWFLEGPPLEWDAMRTPLDALLALRHMLHSGQHQRLLRRFSTERRAPVEALATHLLEHTAEPLALEVEQQGDRAVIHGRKGVKIHMRRENGRWRLHDVTEGGSPK